MSSSFITSGPPVSWMRIAFMQKTLKLGGDHLPIGFRASDIVEHGNLYEPLVR